MVAGAEAIAEELDYDATFAATSIADWTTANSDADVDLLVSLHACDTATDEALAAGARAIILAPCPPRAVDTAGGGPRRVRHGLLRSPCDVAANTLQPCSSCTATAPR